MKKYCFTGEEKIVHTEIAPGLIVASAIVKRIRALVDIREHGVKAGDLGGFIEHEGNLRHEGCAWVSDDACVFQKAMVYEFALVSGNAQVFDKAQVFGRAVISGNSRVYCWPKIGGWSEIAFNGAIGGSDTILNLKMVTAKRTHDEHAARIKTLEDLKRFLDEVVP